MGGHHLPTVVGVCGFRTLIWCRKCAGWAASKEHEKRLKKSMQVQRPEGCSSAYGVEAGIQTKHNFPRALRDLAEGASQTKEV